MKKYKWLLFDVDNTILDFSKASKMSLFKTCQEYGLKCDEDIYKVYKRENAKIWIEFEQKRINTEELRKTRFAGFFNVMGIKGVDPFQFNADYLQNIIHTSEEYEGARDLLLSLKSDYLLSIITNGLKEVQRPRLEKVGMTNLFESIVVSDEIDVAKPELEFFDYTYNSIKNPPNKSEILVIGDNLMSDILGGINFGVDTCWISHGMENKSEMEPTYKINKVFELLDVL